MRRQQTLLEFARFQSALALGIPLDDLPGCETCRRASFLSCRTCLVDLARVYPSARAFLQEDDSQIVEFLKLQVQRAQQRRGLLPDS
jgi:hypothetical protein